MQADIAAPFIAEVYAATGRRMRALIQIAPQNAPDSEAGAFCEWELRGELGRIYSPEVNSEFDCKMALSGCWRALKQGDLAAASGYSAYAATQADEPTIRGIYALYAQARRCFVRKYRVEWDEIFAAWRAHGWRAYLLSAGARPAGYVAIAAGAREARVRIMEFARLPDSTLTLDMALSALYSAGICDSDAEVLCASIDACEAG